MASSLRTFVCVLSVMCLFSAALSEPTFPTIKELVDVFYTTEVHVTDRVTKATASAKEYYSSIDDQGAVKFLSEGQRMSIYYMNDTFEVFEVNDTTCVTWDAGDSEYYYYAAYYGWLTHKPLIIGPSAPLWFAQLGKVKPKFVASNVDVRDIPCDMFSLEVLGDQENVTLDYYFAPEGWITPYSYKEGDKNLRIPIRIHAKGESSLQTAENTWMPVDVIYDFAYFKPTIDDLNDLLPPIGIGCPLRKASENLPKIPSTFQFSAEIVDLLSGEEHADIDVNFLRVWYDYDQKAARLVYYSRKTFLSQLYDFKAGVTYNLVRGGCETKPLKDSFFEMYDEGFVGRMKKPEEVFDFDDTFYDMGQREMRGVKCDVYETVIPEASYMGKRFVKLVVTAFFSEDFINVGVNGITETRIPIYFIVTGWSSYDKIAFKVQYNIYTFHNIIWPPMYDSFQLDRCYTKPESKAYFVLILNIGAADAAKMEEQNDLIIAEVRSKISELAQVSPMRIPFLKADYKPSGVFVTGMILERPPALLQFYFLVTGPSVTYDKNYKPAIDALTIADCATACTDEEDFDCKGFYFCGRTCFLKSIDPYDTNENANSTDLGICDEYIRAEKESTNAKNIYLKDALQNLEDTVLNGNMTIFFKIPNGEEIVKFQDIVIGDGPYTGEDVGDKPYKLNIEYRKLDPDAETTTAVSGVEVANDCYKKCRESEKGCSTFSFCGRSKREEKECLLSSELVVKGITNDKDLVAAMECDIYDLKFLEYFDAYPEQVAFISGYKVIRAVESTEKCAESCRMDKGNKCRGFEYCRSMKTCSLHAKHILDLKEGEKGGASGKSPCVHYAAKYLADYIDTGRVLIEDDSNVRYGTKAEECAKICSEELGESCKSFNHCPGSDGGTCSLSSKLLRDDKITTIDQETCLHYEKRDSVHDWGKVDLKSLAKGGYTKKGFTGLVIGMLALGLILGAVAFVLYSYMRSRRSGEGMSVRFMKQKT